MSSKIYIGLSFDVQDVYCVRIQSFRRRFDTKFAQTGFLNLPLMASIEVGQGDKERFLEAVSEEAGPFFLGQEDAQGPFVDGIAFHQYKRDYLLYLNCNLSEGINYFVESLMELAKEFRVAVPTHKSRPPFMILGRFSKAQDLHRGIEQAQKEMILPFSLRVTGLSVFQKSWNVWNHRRDLFHFERPNFGPLKAGLS